MNDVNISSGIVYQVLRVFWLHTYASFGLSSSKNFLISMTLYFWTQYKVCTRFVFICEFSVCLCNTITIVVMVLVLVKCNFMETKHEKSSRLWNNANGRHHVLVDIVHSLHCDPNVISCVKDDGVHGHVPCPVDAMEPLDMSHPRNSSVVPITDEELVVYKVL